MWHDMSIGVA